MSRNSRRAGRWNAWKITPYCVVIPCMALFFLFFFVCAFQGFAYSLTDWNGVDKTYQFIGLENYRSAFQSRELMSTLKFTMIFAVTTIVLTNVLGLFLAALLDRQLKGRDLFRSVFFFPAVMSGLTVAYIFQQIDYRLVSAVGQAIGSELLTNGLFSSTACAPYAVSVVQVWQSVPITMVIYLAGLQSVPTDVLESARIDGAGGRAIFFRIKLPLIMPSLMVNLINTTKAGITAFDVIMGTTKGGPSSCTYSFAMYMYLQYSDLELAYACAIAMIMFLLFGIIAIAQIVVMRRREVEL